MKREAFIETLSTHILLGGSNIKDVSDYVRATDEKRNLRISTASKVQRDGHNFDWMRATSPMYINSIYREC